MINEFPVYIDEDEFKFHPTMFKGDIAGVKPVEIYRRPIKLKNIRGQESKLQFQIDGIPWVMLVKHYVFQKYMVGMGTSGPENIFNKSYSKKFFNSLVINRDGD